MDSPIDAWLASRPDLAAAVADSDVIEGTAAPGDETRTPSPTEGDSDDQVMGTLEALAYDDVRPRASRPLPTQPQEQTTDEQAAETAQQAAAQTPGNASDSPIRPATQPDSDSPSAKIDAGNADSTGEHQQTTQAGDAKRDATQDAGNVPAADAGGDGLDLTAALARTRVVERLSSEGRWNREMSGLRDQMYREAKKKGMDKEAALTWTYSELDRLYPPKAQRTAPLENGAIPLHDKALETRKENPTPRNDGGLVKGLADLPPGWPELPANASLAAEVGWVQAERLRIVEEKPGSATVVTLSKARSPAPSWAALSWLETSIRSYAKFVEVAAKVASAPDDEQAQVKRERLQLDEIRSLLAEMLD